MGRILLWFYCLPMYHAAALMLLAAAAFRLMEHRWRKYAAFRVMTGVIFVLWIGAMAYSTLANRDSGPYTVCLELFHSYREVLSGGNIEILRSNFMNGALFFPGGVLLGALLPRKWPLWARLALGAVILGSLSAGVESVQYIWMLGRVEADDVLHNSLGAILGLAAASVGRKGSEEV